MNQKLSKILLLLWKNWMLQKRQLTRTCLQFLLPILVCVIMIFIRSRMSPKEQDAVSYNPFCTLPFNIPGVCHLEFMQNTTSDGEIALDEQQSNGEENDIRTFSNNFKYYNLIYAPKTDAVDEVMNPFKLIFQDVVGLNSCAEIDRYYTLHPSRSTFAAVQFDDSLIHRNDLGPDKNINVTIRFPGELRHTDFMDYTVNTWLTNLLYPFESMPGPRNPKSQTGAMPSYFKEGFLTLQHLVSIFITWKNAGLDLPVFNTTNDTTVLLEFLVTHPVPFINMRRFPHTSWTSDPSLVLYKTMIPILFYFGVLYISVTIVTSITEEKEKQLKETMKIMGLTNWMHWTAWFLKSFICLMIIMIFLLIVIKQSWITQFAILPNASSVVLLIFLSLYACALITFSFALSVFCSKATTAEIVGQFGLLISALPYWFTYSSYGTLPLMAKLGFSLAPCTAMGYGFLIIIMYEGSGEGIQLNSIWKPSTVDDNLSLGGVMIMLAMDCLIYLCLALYIEAIFPGEFGVSRKWNFPFKKTFWCGPTKNRVSDIEDSSDRNPNQGQYHESETTNLPIGIEIKNLGKSFGSKVAVRNLSLNMYQDQITVLLGHNGAGKTTTMSMLTGMFPPTSGTAVVSGYDIIKDMDSVRKSLGLCPQQNIIFNDLTVADHLYFFSKLKGLKGKEVDAEVTKYVELLGLKEKRNKKSSSLSGGMKRRLCVGMALCGNSKVVMLDEPTGGLDPSTRRALWDLLLQEKAGRTVLLTTHFMDEADLLGDRIAILAGGQLQCSGSSFFLKKKYGAGYRLIVEKSRNCNPERVTALLRKYIPNIQINTNVGSELTYILTESKSSVFETMLRDLERNSSDLGINSYGISLTTLEEVFMKVGADYDHEEMPNGNRNNSAPPASVSLIAHPMSCPQRLVNQIMAMSMKKCLLTIRSWKMLLFHILVTPILLIIAITNSRAQNIGQNLPSMPLGLNRYSDPVILIQGVENGSEYESKYKHITRDAYQEVTSIHDTMLQLTAETPSLVRQSYIAGASFNSLNLSVSGSFDVNFTVYFNNDPYHTPAVALGLAANAMYRKIVGCDNCGIEFVNHPLAYSVETQMAKLQSTDNLGSTLAQYLGYGMMFVSAFFIIAIVRERSSKSKHLQFVSGVNVCVFWLITWFWDFVTYMIIIIVILIILVCFQVDGFKSAEDLEKIFVVFLYFGWAMLPMIYLAGFIFDLPSTGYNVVIAIIMITGLFVPLTRWLTLMREDIGNICHWIFLIFPHYSMISGIQDVYYLYSLNNKCNNYYEACWKDCSSCTKNQCLETMSPDLRTICEDFDNNYLKWERPGIKRNVLIAVIEGAILLVVLLIIEYRRFSRISCRIKSKNRPTDDTDENDDVQAERLKITNLSNAELKQNYTVAIRDLTKYYKGFLAVNGLCLGITEYECFGLLGVNGAGKTTTFKMLTGDVKISSGNAWVNGKSIKNPMNKVQIGYCPQFDALLDNLTARETLIMFALSRGIPLKNCKRVVVKLAADFDYQMHLDKKVKKLSGGTKRKLSTSIALIGNPSVIYLDEPSVGMDTSAKRQVWNTLCAVRDTGKTIVLTSNNMEECEALCTRLAIMVNGQFKCLGSTQHLKSKFAEKYTITIKIRKTDELSGTDQLKRFMQENFPTSRLQEEHDEFLTYYVSDRNVQLSTMFGILEKAKNRADLKIEDYSLGQSSLEQVFLTFSKSQRTEM